MKYDFAAIEKKWQDKWEESKPYAAVTGDTTKPKFYGLIEFRRSRSGRFDTHNQKRNRSSDYQSGCSGSGVRS